MAHANHTRRLARTEETLTVLFCLVDDAYALLNPHRDRYELTAANVAEVKLTEELLLDGANLGTEVARRLFGDLLPTGAGRWKLRWPKRASCW